MNRNIIWKKKDLFKIYNYIKIYYIQQQKRVKQMDRPWTKTHHNTSADYYG